MKKEVMKKWVKALRSGKYRQGREVLYNKEDDSYCCLGVLCKTLGVKQPNRVKSRKGTNRLLSDSLRDKAGMETNTGCFGGDSCDYSSDLTSLNDFGKSFKYIADLIEKCWDKL